MSYITKIGIVTYAKDMHKDGGESQAWFEGFAVGMNEAGAIDEEELYCVLEALSIEFNPKENE